MKRNQQSVRIGHMAKGTPAGKSKYAQKVRSGNQMYGPGCCAHKISRERVLVAKRGDLTFEQPVDELVHTVRAHAKQREA